MPAGRREDGAEGQRTTEGRHHWGQWQQPPEEAAPAGVTVHGAGGVSVVPGASTHQVDGTQPAPCSARQQR